MMQMCVNMQYLRDYGCSASAWHVILVYIFLYLLFHFMSYSKDDNIEVCSVCKKWWFLIWRGMAEVVLIVCAWIWHDYASGSNNNCHWLIETGCFILCIPLIFIIHLLVDKCKYKHNIQKRLAALNATCFLALLGIGAFAGFSLGLKFIAPCFIITSFIFIYQLCCWYRKVNAPIENSGKQRTEVPDKLGRALEFDRIYNWLTQQNEQVCLAVVGRWGSGKSFLINYIRNKSQVNKLNMKFVDVNLWQCANEKELNDSVYSALELAYFGAAVPLSRFTAMMHNLNHLGNLWGYVYKAAQVFSELQEEKLTNSFSDELGDKKVVLVMDNVERTPIDILHTLFPLMERLKKIHGLSIIFSVADEDVAYGMGQERKPLDRNVFVGALHKLVDYIYYMPGLDQSCALNMMKSEMPDFWCPGVMKKLAYDTPRQVLRLAKNLSFFETVSHLSPSVKTLEQSKLAEYEKLLEEYCLPIYAMYAIRENYQALYTILQEQAEDEYRLSSLWMRKEYSLIIQNCYQWFSSLCSKEENVDSKDNDSSLPLRVLGDPKRFFMLRERTIHYSQELLFTSALKSITRNQVKKSIEALETFRKGFPFSMDIAIILNAQSKTFSTFKDVLKHVCETSSHDLLTNEYIGALTKYASNLFERACAEDEESEAYDRLDAIYKMANYTLSENISCCWDGMIGPITMVYIMSYCCSKDDVHLLSILCEQISRNSRAHVYLAIDIMEKKNKIFKFDSLSKTHQKALLAGLSLFKELKNSLKADYEAEMAVNSIDYNGKKVLIRVENHENSKSMGQGKSERGDCVPRGTQSPV